MNLRDLEYLVALAEHRHFGRAAEASYVSQPTLSTQLKKLETELGVPLFERTSRTVLLTSAGERIVERARRVLDEVDDIHTIARRTRDPRSGTIRLGIFPTLGPYLLPHVLPRVHAEMPDLEVLLVEERTGDLLDRLRAGTLDAAVLALPIADDAFHVDPMFTEDFVLAAPAAGGDPGPVTVDALAGQDVLLLEDGHCLRDQALSVCRQAGAHERDGFRATSLETLRLMVGSGVGVTLLPRLAVSPPVPPQADVVLREFEGPTPYREIGLVRRRSSLRADLLTDLARVLADVPGGLVTPLGSGDVLSEVGGTVAG